MNYSVRPAANEDAEAVSAVFAASWKHAYKGIVNWEYLSGLRRDHWVEFFKANIKNRRVDYYVIEDDRIIGGAVARESLIKQYPEDWELVSLYLEPESMGRGAGRILLEALEARMRERGKTHCVLDVLEENHKSIGFYKRMGYRETGHTTPVRLGEQDLTCLVMRKEL